MPARLSTPAQLALAMAMAVAMAMTVMAMKMTTMMLPKTTPRNNKNVTIKLYCPARAVAFDFALGAASNLPPLSASSLA